MTSMPHREDVPCGKKREVASFFDMTGMRSDCASPGMMECGTKDLSQFGWEALSLRAGGCGMAETSV